MRLSLSGVALLAVLAAWMPAAFAGAAGAGRPGGRAARAMQLERALGPGVDVRLHRETGRVRFVGTPPGRPIPGEIGPGAPAATARAFLDSHRRDFGLERGSGELRVTAVVPNGGGAAVRMRQAIDGVPVLAGELVVGVDAAGDVLSVLGEVEPGEVDTTAEIAPAEARRTAILAVAKYRRAPADGLRATEPSLAVYDSRLLGGPGLGAPALVWRVEVSSTSDPALRELVLVDAHLGVVAETIDLTQEAKDRRVCDAGNEDSDYPCVGPYDREEGEELPTENPDVDAAYDFAGDTYDFFSVRFGRDSLDGAGLPLISTVRYCEEGEPCPFENAFWDGAQMVYGEGYAAADDVVGHELSHGFTQYTSNLFYWYQSGAINESMSDVFGEYVDLTNDENTDPPADRWLLGEDVPGGAIRDMEDPPAMNDPDRMTSSKFVADVDQDDNGGVHTNSGVGNKAAYLIADGDTFNGRTVTGIGIAKAARVYHDAEVGLLTSGSDYADLYEALQQACANAVGGSEGIAVADCEEVKDAVEATEMNLQPPVASAPEAPTCGVGTVPVDLFHDDLENPGSGNWAHTALSGPDDWYYPQNPNPYGFEATYATSGTTNFWGYDRSTTADYAIAATADVAIPAGQVYLRFDHSYAFEDAEGDEERYDGGQLEYSTDGGSTWLDAGPLFTDNGYNGVITDEYDNPLGGEAAFTAESNGYISSRVDLSGLAGEGVRFRFRIGTDEIFDDYGWFVDDVRVYQCLDEEAPAEPTLTATDPDSPANDNEPLVSGASESGSTVRLYRAPSVSDCESGNLAGEGPAADFESSGVPASVPDDAVTILRATAEDGSENVSPCSADSLAYVEDSQPPAVTIDTGPAQGATIAVRTPTFGFSADEPNSTFECRFDSDSFAPCSGPGASHTPPQPLADGPHTFEVRATDEAGNQDAQGRDFEVEAGAAEPLPPGPAPPVPSAPSLRLLPTDGTPPRVALFGRRRQTAGGAIAVGARCSEACVAVARGAVVLRRPKGTTSAGAASRRRIRVGLRPARRRVVAERAARLRLRPRSRRAARRLRRLVRRGWKANAAIRVRFSDLSRNSTARRIGVALTIRGRR